tara:strand:+ start:69 stop:296 length:228 start_codon:yes stop_codon:yes gene_type:complete
VSDKVEIALSADIALVIFDWLSELESEKHEETLMDEATAIALNTLLCELEKVLVEPFSENYGELVERARSNVTTS